MPIKISNKKLKEFGILIGLLIPIIIGWFIPKISGHEFRFWTIFISIPLIFFAFTFPKLLLRPYLLWMSLGKLLGIINSYIILGSIFLILVIPISLLMKIFKYDPLRQKKIDVQSYRENKERYNVDLRRIF